MSNKKNVPDIIITVSEGRVTRVLTQRRLGDVEVVINDLDDLYEEDPFDLDADYEPPTGNVLDQPEIAAAIILGEYNESI